MAILLFDHEAKLLLLASVDTLEVHVDNPEPLLIFDLMGLPATAPDAGVVDGDVKATKLGGGLSNTLLDLSGITDVHVQGQNLDIGEALFQGGVCFFESREVDIGQGQLGDAMLCKGDGRVLSDA